MATNNVTEQVNALVSDICIPKIRHISVVDERDHEQKKIYQENGTNDDENCKINGKHKAEQKTYQSDTDATSESSLDPEEMKQAREAFFDDAQTYWSSVAPTVDGMLGGFGNISFIDIRGSLSYLNEVFKMKPPPARRYALDCGAGIGRVTKHLLLPVFEKVDLVEQNTHFTDSVPSYIGSTPKLGKVFNQGLQDFAPETGKYDVIWSQWVLGHLPDVDLVSFFQRCIKGLNRNGVMIIKENITSADTVEVDKVDSSVTRPLVLLKSLLIKSGMRIIKITKQNNFPAGIFPVYMITVKPAKSH